MNLESAPRPEVKAEGDLAPDVSVVSDEAPRKDDVVNAFALGKQARDLRNVVGKHEDETAHHVLVAILLTPGGACDCNLFTGQGLGVRLQG